MKTLSKCTLRKPPVRLSRMFHTSSVQGFNLPTRALAKADWRGVATLVFVLLRETTVGQSLPDCMEAWGLPDSIWQTAIDRLPSTIPASRAGVNSGSSTLSRTDSLKLKLLDIEIAKAELNVNKANLWHRLIPDVRVSASFGIRQLIFIDPTSFIPYALPRDSYRLTASLSLSEVFNSNRHEEALLELDRHKTARTVLEAQLRRETGRQRLELGALQRELDFRIEELTLLKQNLAYVELLFEQGKADYAALIRARLQVLTSKKTIERLQAELDNEQSTTNR